MSVETAKAELEAAIDRYKAEMGDDGEVMTSWVLITASFIDGHQTAYRRIDPDEQPIHVSLGLLDYAKRPYGAEVTASALGLDGDDEEDE